MDSVKKSLTGIIHLTALGNLLQMSSGTKQSAIRIVDRETEAKVLVDPMRREILRLLSKQALTERNLSKMLDLSAPSVGFHLKSLKNAGLASVIRREAGSHGIIQKFYLASAQAFVVDKEHLPLQLKRYFMPTDLERVRGAVACMSLLRENTPYPSSDSMEKLAHQLCGSIVRVAEKYKNSVVEDDPEPIINRLYKEALREVVGKEI